MVVKSDGAIWFTDPSYAPPAGLRRPSRSSATTSTATTASCELVADGFEKPNGLAFSPDESVLYVGDSERAA